MKLSVVLFGLGYDEKYGHTLSLGCLKAYADSRPELKSLVRTTILEGAVSEPVATQVSAILAQRPQVLGFSCYPWNISRAQELCREVKRRAPGVRILLGGPAVSVRAADILREHPEVDVVVRGEGELTVAELLKAYAAGRGAEGVAGIAHRSRDGVVEERLRPLIEDLAILPSPYLTGIFRASAGDRLILEGSRGCPHQCRFCDWQHSGKTTRWFPKERVLAEVETVARQAAAVNYFIADADFFVQEGRAIELLAGFDRITGRHATSWHLAGNLGNITPALAAALNSFKFSIGAGIQSTQPKVLKRIARGFGRRNVERAIRLLREQAPQVSLHLQLIHGLPSDDLAGYRRSLEWALSMQSDVLFLPRALALPGAEFGRHPEEYGLTVTREPPYIVLHTDTFHEGEVKAAELLAFRVQNLHRSGVLRRALQLLGAAPLASPGAADDTPWVDRYERLHGRLESGMDFFRRISEWFEGLSVFDKAINFNPEWWDDIPTSERLEGLVMLADFAERELREQGRASDWPAVRRFLRVWEARFLWEQVAGTSAFRNLLAQFLGEVAAGSENIFWLGWESRSQEYRICPRAWLAHLVSGNGGFCPFLEAVHIHLEERHRLDRWEAILPPLGLGMERAVLSNIYPAIPPEHRVAVLAAIRERTRSKDGGVLLWTDSVGLSPHEFISSEGARRCAEEARVGRGGVLSDLRRAGWKDLSEPSTLSAEGSLNGRVTWTFFSARPAE